MRTRIPLYDLRVSQETLRRVEQALRSGWLSSGPQVEKFEHAAARYLGVKHVAAVDSATSGLILALKAIGVTRGSEVITTPLTFVATVSSILHCGAKPVLADINQSNLTIDPDDISRRITRRTKCILPVDIAGQPCDYASLARVARAHAVPLVSDSAHAFGALLAGKAVARYTNLSVYSFHATKNLTCGEGGLVTSRRRAEIERVRLLSRHAMSSTAYMRRQSGGWQYDVSDLGYKFNMPEVNAAVGLGQLENFEREQAMRKMLVGRYIKRLQPLLEYLELPTPVAGAESAWHLFIIKLRLERLRVSRNRFIALMAESGIECGVHYRPIYELSFYRQLGYTGRTLPNTRAVANRLVTLPLYARLKPAQVDVIADRTAAIVRRYSR
jgi:dTDP-4-amino-4,6-dideoxygalactose transaminase